MEEKSRQDEIHDVGVKRRYLRHIPLLDRPREPSIDERLQRLAGAREESAAPPLDGRN